MDYECPKCKAEYVAAGNDEDAGEHICEECGYKFIVEIEYDPSYSTRCAEHDWKPYRSGFGFVGQQCSVCSTLEFLDQ